MPCAFSMQSFRYRKWHGLLHGHFGGAGYLHLGPGRFFLQVPTPDGVYIVLDGVIGGGFKCVHCHPVLGMLIQLEEHLLSNGWLYYSTITQLVDEILCKEMYKFIYNIRYIYIYLYCLYNIMI